MNWLVLGLAFTAAFGASAAPPLPVPSATWVSAGAALPPVVTNQTMGITQLTPKVTLNWESFNVDAGHTVNFAQPSAAAIALNLIHQNDPAVIRGALNANGEVWLLNQNGIVFGAGAQVNVRGLVASSLNVTPDAGALGIAPPSAQGFSGPAFAGDLDGAGHPLSGGIHIDQGANITTNGANGRVFVFAPEVTNEGTISAADGQVALAAGSKIFIRQPAVGQGSGLVVEVGDGGTVTNGATSNTGNQDPTKLLGQIVADRGTATLVGLSVNQLGRVSANSAVRANGRVQLRARTVRSSGPALIPERGGELVLGQNSETAANPALTDQTVVADASDRLTGTVQLVGKSVVLGVNAKIEARGGVVTAQANDNGDDAHTLSDTEATSSSRIVMESGSRIDVSGTHATLAATRNALTVKLQGAELKDRPVQRDGVLRGKTITVDLRRHGTLADGTPWIGTPLADLTNASAADLKRDNTERNSVGGKVVLEAQGGVLLRTGSVIDVSGGSAFYAGGDVQTSKLLREGRIFDIGSADPNVSYDGLIGQFDYVHEKWGPTESWHLFEVEQRAVATDSGYFEGRDAGTVNIVAPNLLLDGDLRGAAQAGLLQRNPTDLAVALSLSRAFDQLPRPGRLVLGLDSTVARDPQYIAPDFYFDARTAPTVAANFNLAGTDFPLASKNVRLAADWFGAHKLGYLDIFSEGKVIVGSPLNLGGGGGLAIAAGEIQVAGNIVAPAGEISLFARDTADGVAATPSTGTLIIAENARIDVSGQWINEATAQNSSTQTTGGPRLLDGGSIHLTAQGKQLGTGGLFIASGSLLRANGGGAVSRSGKLTAGSAGDLTLTARTDPNGERFAVPLELNGTLMAYGITRGGKLTINAGGICIATAGCGASEVGRVDLSPAYFRTGGFESFALTATGGSATVRAGTELLLQQQNRVLAADFSAQPTGSDISAFSSLQTLAKNLRHASALSLTVKAQNPQNQFDNHALQQAGLLDLQTGASLVGDLAATITLASETRLQIDGRVEAPAGAITVSLLSGISGARLLEHLAAQSLWLGPHAALLSVGEFLPSPNSRGLLSGTLLDGGTVSLNASSGYVVAETGAIIDVRGITADLDIFPSGNNARTPLRQTLASDSGEINIGAAEGILFDGSLRAAAAQAGARAGSLTFALDAQARNDSADLSAATLSLPTGPRVIQLDHGDFTKVPKLLRPGDALPSELNGPARISDTQLAAGGFGDLRLHARNYSRQPVESIREAGLIRVADGTTISASRRLMLEAAGVESMGGKVTLSAPYMALGNPDDNHDLLNLDPQFTPPLESGEGMLEAVAENIDFVGNLRLNGWRSAAFRSTGDIRLRGVQPLNLARVATKGIGELETKGNLEFTARQIFPTTLSDYTIAVRDNPAGRIDIRGGADNTPVMSVGGALTLAAPVIVQAGQLKAPLGTISLAAETELSLLPGSKTSTSLEGLTALFGRIEIGKDWVYLLDGAVGNAQGRLVFTEQSNRAADPFPTGTVDLRGPSIQLLAGATVNLSGGGELLAYEFEPGLSGSDDPFNVTSSPLSYAVLPSLQSSLGAYDPQEQLGFSLAPGEGIEFLSGLPGLPRGRYALLPARFSLLPGAFLITPQHGFSDLSDAAQVPMTAGGSIIAGRRIFANSGEGDLRSSGFLVRNAQDTAALGKFNLERASDFAGLAGQARPQDAGTVRIVASQILALGGALKSAPGFGGAGARAEISGAALKIVNGAAAMTAPPATLLLDAGGLNSLGATTLFFGGTSTFLGGVRTLSIDATEIEIGAGVKLTAPEIILAATNSITVGSDSEINAAGSEISVGQTLAVNGDGALLRVSNGQQATLLRTHEIGAHGTLDLQAGATLIASGSSLLDASLNTLLSGALQISGSLNLGAPRISLGTPTQPSVGLILSSAFLDSFAVSQLVLTSREGLDLYGGLNLHFDSLQIQGPGIGGYENNGLQSSVAAHGVRMSNATGLNYVSPAGAVLGHGQLNLTSEELTFGNGHLPGFSLSGFDTVALSADTLRGEGLTRLAVAGDLAITTARIAPIAGASIVIEATGGLVFGSRVAPLPPLESLGGSVLLKGARVSASGRLQLPAGKVTLQAIGTESGDDISLSADSLIEVAGRQVIFGGTPVFAPAGEVSLFSEHGDLRLSTGATIDLRGSPTGGAAGSLRLQAAEGNVEIAGATLLADAAPGYSDGKFFLETSTLSGSDFGALFEQTSRAGFQENLEARVRRGSVDLASARIQSHAISITVDNGDLTLGGVLDASGEQGGRIHLAAAEQIFLGSGTVLDAHATAEDGVGGQVMLESASATDGTLVSGGITILDGATVNLAGPQQGGKLHLRLPEASVLTLADIDGANDRLSVRGAVTSFGTAILEGFHAYREDSITQGDTFTIGNARFDNASLFLSNAPAIRTSLGSLGEHSAFHVRPGLELRSITEDATLAASDLTLAAIWDLANWRFAGEPGILTLRAAGNLYLADILSDGFNGVADLARVDADGRSQRCANPSACAIRPTGLPTLQTSGESWSYRLVAGADFGSANSMAALAADGLVRNGHGVGNVTLQGGTVSVPNPLSGANQPPVLRPILNAVRTGTGDIQISAARDVTLGNRAAIIYTAGLDTGLGIRLGTTNAAGRSTVGRRAYPEQGGDVVVRAGGNLNGVAPALDFATDSLQFPRQLVSSWLVRQGDIGGLNRATGWTIAFEFFEQGMAALGGGDVDVAAGKDVYNLSVSAPSIGRQIGGITAAASALEVLGGGSIKVAAGRDIRSGVFYVGKGSGELLAGGDITSGRPIGTTSEDLLYPVLALSEGRISLAASGSLDFAGVVNPTFIPQGPSQFEEIRLERNSYFLTYAETSGVSAVSLNGNIKLHDLASSAASAFELKSPSSLDKRALRVFAPSLAVTAFNGNIEVDSEITLFPASAGNLLLLAGGSVDLFRSLSLSDVGAAALPGITNPQAFNLSDAQSALANLLDAQNPQQALATRPVHQGHSLNSPQALVVARTGDISSASGALLFLARPATLHAGRDLVNLHLIVEHTDLEDVSVLRAGRDLRYPSPRLITDTAVGAPGALLPTTNGIEAWGPGRLWVQTGRNLELGTAGGITSAGSSVNSALMNPGASISIFGGVGDAELEFAPFIERYFALASMTNPDSVYLPALVQFVRGLEGAPALTPTEALSRFKTLAPARQISKLLDVFFSELRDTGRAAAGSKTPNYDRGDEAIRTLFSSITETSGELDNGSRTVGAAGSLVRQPFKPRTHGDLNLYFSKIFTVTGGDIDVLAPGGDINVGLATPPDSFGISKSANNLGIVAENVGDVRAYLNGDFDVNESRVFAADGGDILVWSNDGDIDAGRGARSAIAVPAVGFQFDNDGHVTESVPPAIQGSGIRAFTTTAARAFGNVDLVTPRGVVNASEAGIESAGNITIAAVSVLGADNIKAGGTTTGAPVASAGSIGASVGGAAGAASAATNAASSVGGTTDRQADASDTFRNVNLSIISVEVLGFGDG